MVTTRAPLRVSFFGGGSDLPNYSSSCRGPAGHILSMAINKYVYIQVSESDRFRVNYSKKEVCQNIQDIQHDIVKTALGVFGIDHPVEITCNADVPKGTGLGSSGAFSVALVLALQAYTRSMARVNEIAEKATLIELRTKTTGFQDQYAAAFGGIRQYSGKVDTNSVKVVASQNIDFETFIREIHQKGYFLLLNSGIQRDSNEILTKQDKISRSVPTSDLVALAHKWSSIVAWKDSLPTSVKDYGMLSVTSNNPFPQLLTQFKEDLNQSWEIKRSLSEGISNPELDSTYSKIRQFDCGCKLLGAGGGGYFLVVAAKEDHPAIIESTGLQSLPFEISDQGVELIPNVELQK